MMLDTNTGEMTKISEADGKMIENLKEVAEQPDCPSDIKRKADEISHLVVFYDGELINIKGGNFFIKNFGKKQAVIEALPKTSMTENVAFAQYLQRTTPEQRAALKQLTRIEGEIVNAAIAFKKSNDNTALFSALGIHEALLKKIEEMTKVESANSEAANAQA